MPAALVNQQLTTSPFPLGFIKPTAGTPLTITSNYSDLGGRQFHQVFIQALPTNSRGYVYVLNSSAAADKTNGTNVLAILATGQSFSQTSYQINNVMASGIWIDVDGTGDGALATVQEA